MYVIIVGRVRKPMELSVMDFDEANNFPRAEFLRAVKEEEIHLVKLING